MHIPVISYIIGMDLEREVSMRIIYRPWEDGVEVVKCFGSDSDIEVPDSLGGRPVRKIAAYAFSDRDDSWRSVDASIKEPVLAGAKVRAVALPDTVAVMDRYVFYGCKYLNRLSFSDALQNIGTGCFNLCGQDMHLTVRMRSGERSCVKDILGDLWQRVDVDFLYADGRQARLLFPEHYEEARENTPARILYTHHHGSGNNYRQCFYDRQVDFRKYDDLFAVGRVYDRIDVLTDLVFGRLLYPVELWEASRNAYMDFVREHQEEIAPVLVEKEYIDACRFMDENRLWTSRGLETAVAAAAQGKRTELAALLMDMQLRVPAQKKQFLL